MGLVAGDRRAASVAAGDDAESDVRGRRDLAGCAADRHRCCPVQDHEGLLGRCPVWCDCLLSVMRCRVAEAPALRPLTMI